MSEDASAAVDETPSLQSGEKAHTPRHARRLSESSSVSALSVDYADSATHAQGASSPIPNLQALLRICNIMAVCYLVCSAVTFYSSAYTGPGSALDVVLVMFDVVCIDISSALFVMTGCAMATLYSKSTPQKKNALTRHMAISILVDLYVAMCLSLVLGSAHALVLGRFQWRDVGFTALEGVTTLRALDFQQSPSAPHSYNVTAWPVQTLLWCVLSLKCLLAFDALIVTRAPAMADAVICIMAVTGVVLFTSFGSMQASSNIFYANACSVTYRTLEFNLGVHAVFLYQRHPPFFAALHNVCRQALGVVSWIIATIWIAEIGRVAPASSADTCLRLYYRNSCLEDYNGFFFRGCVFALFLLLYTDTKPAEGLQREMRISMTLVSAVCMCWPVCIAVKLVFDFTFGTTVIDSNRPVVLMISACILSMLSVSYRIVLHPTLHAWARRLLLQPATSAAHPPESVHTALV